MPEVSLEGYGCRIDAIPLDVSRAQENGLRLEISDDARGIIEPALLVFASCGSNLIAMVGNDEVRIAPFVVVSPRGIFIQLDEGNFNFIRGCNQVNSPDMPNGGLEPGRTIIPNLMKIRYLAFSGYLDGWLYMGNVADIEAIAEQIQVRASSGNWYNDMKKNVLPEVKKQLHSAVQEISATVAV